MKKVVCAVVTLVLAQLIGFLGVYIADNASGFFGFILMCVAVLMVIASIAMLVVKVDE